MPTLHQIISARGAVEKSGACFIQLAYYNRKCWFGNCEEVMSAMDDPREHNVEVHDNIRVIYRQGYTAPHFVQCGSGFINPFWS